MFSGRVIGNAVSTIKNPKLSSISLLVVELDGSHSPGQAIIAGDATRQAGPGDHVYLIDSMEASFVFRDGYVPCDAAICGFIDTYNKQIK